MTDKKLLTEEIKKSGLKKEYVAQVLKMTPQSFSNKLAGRTDFTISEAKKIIELLGLSVKTREKIFFWDRSTLNREHRKEIGNEKSQKNPESC